MRVTPPTSLLTRLGPLWLLLLSENKTTPIRAAFPHCPWNPGAVAGLKIVCSIGASSRAGEGRGENLNSGLGRAQQQPAKKWAYIAPLTRSGNVWISHRISSKIHVFHVCRYTYTHVHAHAHANARANTLVSYAVRSHVSNQLMYYIYVTTSNGRQVSLNILQTFIPSPWSTSECKHKFA
jgi:hypothetical protein